MLSVCCWQGVGQALCLPCIKREAKANRSIWPPQPRRFQLLFLLLLLLAAAVTAVPVATCCCSLLTGSAVNDNNDDDVDDIILDTPYASWEWYM